MLDCTGSFSDTAKVGNPLYQAPEVLRAFLDANILYTPSSAHLSLLPSAVCPFGGCQIDKYQWGTCCPQKGGMLQPEGKGEG